MKFIFRSPVVGLPALDCLGLVQWVAGDA